MVQDEAKRTAKDFSGRQQEAFEIYKRLNRANQHKMNAIPVCLLPNSLK
jgi:NAD+ synthase